MNRCGEYLGFAFVDGKRYGMHDASELERAWCECGELCDQELWKEAEEKLYEYQDLPDQILIVCVISGRNKARSVANGGTSEEKKEAFEESLRALKHWLVNSNNMDDDWMIASFNSFQKERTIINS